MTKKAGKGLMKGKKNKDHQTLTPTTYHLSPTTPSPIKNADIVKNSHKRQNITCFILPFDTLLLPLWQN